MARSKLSAILAGGLLLCCGLQPASAGLFDFFHHSDCCCRECCREYECEESEKDEDHCCCFNPPCPPDGLFAYSVVPLELNGVAQFPVQNPRDQQRKPDERKGDKREDEKKEDAPAEARQCTLEDVCKRQDKMDEQLNQLDQDLSELTASVKKLTSSVKSIQKKSIDATQQKKN